MAGEKAGYFEDAGKFGLATAEKLSWVVTNTALHLVVRENYIANQKKKKSEKACDGEGLLYKTS